MGCGCGSKRKRLQKTSVQSAQEQVNTDAAEIVVVASEKTSGKQSDQNK